MMRRNAALIAILLIALVVGGFMLLAEHEGTSEPAAVMQRYSSEDGISFQYPDQYALSSKTAGNAEYQWDVLRLVHKGAQAPQDSELPPAISMSVFIVPAGTSVEQWVRGDARSNFKLSDGRLSTTTVGGEEALSYSHSGLYETDTVAVMHKGKIFLLEGEWLAAADPLRQDFKNLVQSIQFNP